MLTLEDCVALSDLMPEEIDALVEHEHLPAVVAIELGCCLVHCPDGRQVLRAMIRDDIEEAQRRRDFRHAAALKLVLQHFVSRCRHDPALSGRWNEPARSRL
jgi:hypothetical protein